MIETTRSDSGYTYRLRDRSRIIERRLNQHRARWHSWRMYDSHDEAKAMLLSMQQPAGDDEVIEAVE